MNAHTTHSIANRIFSALVIGCLVAAAGVFADTLICTDVIDGDTVKLSNGEKVRLIGVDTPESKHPQKPVQWYAKEATQYLTDKLEGKSVELLFDSANSARGHRDKYGRTLAYVFRGDELVNEQIIRDGYGHAYTKYPYDASMQKMFRTAEQDARDSRAGLWSDGEKHSGGGNESLSASVVKSFFRGLTGQRFRKDKEPSCAADAVRGKSAMRRGRAKAGGYHGLRTKSQSRAGTTGSASGKGRVHVSSYYRSDGTYVPSHYRSAPTRGASSGSSAVSGGKSVHVRSYTRSDGTSVKSHYRSRPSRSSSSRSVASGGSSSRSGGGGRVSVSGYTRSNGTYVRGYTRSAPSRGGKK